MMITREQRLPTAIASLALFVALGGTSYAVAKLPRNSVGASQLQTNAVTSSKIRDGAVAREDLAPGAVVAGPRGPRGEEGPRGATGATGAPGPQGVSLVYANRFGAATVLPANPGALKVNTLRVPAGSYVLDFNVAVFLTGAGSGVWVDCVLEADGSPLSSKAVAVGEGSGFAGEQVLSISEVAAFSAATTVGAACSQRGTSNPRVANGRLLAVKADAMEIQ